MRERQRSGYIGVTSLSLHGPFRSLPGPGTGTGARGSRSGHGPPRCAANDERKAWSEERSSGARGEGDDETRCGKGQ